MYTDVIVGFDGSASGHDALALARRLASIAGAAPTVVCVHPYMALTADVADEAAEDLSWRSGAEHILEEARRLLADVPNARFRAVPETSPARVLHEIAGEREAALIVVGSTHRKGLGRLLPGSTADQVLHAAPCSVAVAPAGYATRPQRSPAGVIGAAVDGGEETERIARLAARIARGARARLRLVTVAEMHYTTGPLYAGNLGHLALRDTVRSAADQALDRAAMAAGGGEDVETRLREGSAADELIAESHDLDLLVLGARAYGPLRRLLLGSVGSGVLHGAACPVLAIPRCAPEDSDRPVASMARGAVGLTAH